MSAKLIVFTWLLSMGTSAQTLPKFMGRVVTVIEPEHTEDRFPKGPVSICIEGPPRRQCYTAPKEFGLNPTVALIQLDKNTPALLFSAASGGVSGWEVHFALLRPGAGKDLDDSFPSITVSDQNEAVFWNEPSISTAPIFLTADVAWGSDQAIHGEHRCIISAYMRTSPSYPDDIYLLEDRYMTVRRFDLGASAHVLASEKQEILARLRRVKAAAQSQQ